MPTTAAGSSRTFGEFHVLGEARLTRPSTAWLTRPYGPGVRLHVLSNTPLTAYNATSPDPIDGTDAGRGGEGGAGPPAWSSAAVPRTRKLKTTFVTVYEPLGTACHPCCVSGRVWSPPGTVIVYLETAEGSEHVLINLTPGKAQAVTLSDGWPLRTDGLVVVLGRGTGAGRRFVRRIGGTAGSPGTGDGDDRGGEPRGVSAAGRGWFLTDNPVPDPDALVGRTLLIRHGDGTTHGWTMTRVENLPEGNGAGLHVHEEPGFLIDADSGVARFYQFPRNSVQGPHTFHVSRITRAEIAGPIPGRNRPPTSR